ncbi:unnamed protein product [Pylaiella littoralis]
MSFRCPVTIETVFNAPTDEQVEQFYEARNIDRKPFSLLSQDEKLTWGQSLHDNKSLMGFLIYSQLLPSLLKNRIKANNTSYHWNALDSTCERGRRKLEQREEAIARLKRTGSARSVMQGLSYTIDKRISVLALINVDISEEDDSSVYLSCSGALGLLWFSTAVLGRPCCFESVILPLNTTERRVMEQRFDCPGQFLDGPIKGFQTNWKSVFSAIGTSHRNSDYVILERACQEKHIDGLHVADPFIVFRATMSFPGDVKRIAAQVENYKQSSKSNIDNGPIVGINDVIREKLEEYIGALDGTVLAAISSTFGQEASLEVQEQCLGMQDGKWCLFDASISTKVGEIMAHLDSQMWWSRKQSKTQKNVNANLDPAGLNKKIDGGRILDPMDPKSAERMHEMLKALSRQVWRPLKSLIGKALGSSLEYPAAFLQISSEEAGRLYEHALVEGVKYSDMANLYTLLHLSMGFHRSQNTRESMVHEFSLSPDQTHYKFRFRGRSYKTASTSASSGAPPVSHFNLSPDQSMIVKYIYSVGHLFCGVNVEDETRGLLFNVKGESWTQGDLSVRFKRVGAHWLGIENFGPHGCRTFWATHALNSEQVNASNVDAFSSYLQVSTATLRNSYMSSGAHTAAHAIGSEVGSVVNAACTGEVSDQGASPSGKKLSARRLEFMGDIRASLLKYGGDTKLLFRALVKKRKASQLGEGEKWFRWQNTFWRDDGLRYFKRFLKETNSQ